MKTACAIQPWTATMLNKLLLWFPREQTNYCHLYSDKYKIVSNTLVLRLTPYVDETIGDHQHEFGHSRSPTDQIFCIHQILEKMWEYNGTEHQLFIDCEKASGLVRREVLYSILTEVGISMILVRLIKMCLNKTCSKVCRGKNLSDTFPIQNGLKQGDALSPLL